MFALHAHIKGIIPEQLVRIESERGDFYVCTAGFHPQAFFCFFYGDGKYQFFFYAKARTANRGQPDIEIHDASVGRMEWGDPRVSPTDVVGIESNIRRLFRERSFLVPSEIALPKEVPSSIEFTRGLGK